MNKYFGIYYFTKLLFDNKVKLDKAMLGIGLMPITDLITSVRDAEIDDEFDEQYLIKKEILIAARTIKLNQFE